MQIVLKSETRLGYIFSRFCGYVGEYFNITWWTITAYLVIAIQLVKDSSHEQPKRRVRATVGGVMDIQEGDLTQRLKNCRGEGRDATKTLLDYTNIIKMTNAAYKTHHRSAHARIFIKMEATHRSSWCRCDKGSYGAVPKAQYWSGQTLDLNETDESKMGHRESPLEMHAEHVFCRLCHIQWQMQADLGKLLFHRESRREIRPFCPSNL